MLGTGILRKAGYTVKGWFEYSASFGLAIETTVLGLPKDTVTSWPPFARGTTENMTTYSFELYMVFTVMLFIGLGLRRISDPKVLNDIEFILDGMRNKIYSGVDGCAANKNRVTLFEYKRWIFFMRRDGHPWYWPYGNGWPGSGWLKPVVRSPFHVNQVSKAIFMVPDLADNAEGIAGKAWVDSRIVVADNLPDINKQRRTTGSRRGDTANRALDTRVEKYAEKTFLPKKRIQNAYSNKSKNAPLSIGAIPVETGDGKPWGLVVLDSESPSGVKEMEISNYSLAIAMLGRTVERL